MMGSWMRVRSIQQYEQCLGAATTLAESQSPFTFSNGAQEVASAGASWLQTAESATVSTIGDVASLGLKVVGVVSTIAEVAQAYDSCS